MTTSLYSLQTKDYNWICSLKELDMFVLMGNKVALVLSYFCFWEKGRNLVSMNLDFEILIKTWA